MNYSNDFYNQNTYNTHIKFDHISQQQNFIEAFDDCIISNLDEQPDTPERSQELQ